MKKVISLCLAVALLLPLLPAGRAVYTVDVKQNTGTQPLGDCDASASAVFSSAVVRNQQSGGSAAAKRLEAVVQLKDGVAGHSNVTAVIMKSDVYDRLFPAGPSAKGMAGNQLTTFLKDMSSAEQKYYAAGVAKTTADAPTMAVQFADISKYDSSSPANSKEMEPAKATSAGYFVSYTLIVFGDANRESNHGYYVDRFDVDSAGYVRTPSYMLWYDGNKPTAAAGTVSNNTNTPAIYRADTYEGLAETVTLKGQTPDATAGATPKDTPKLEGYAFLGWNEVQSAAAPAYSTQTSMAYHKPANDPAQLYQAHMLYAVWETIEVKFDHEKDDDLELAPGQVGKPYQDGTVGSTLLAVGKTDGNTPADYRSDPRTAKTYTVTKAEWKNADGTYEAIGDPVNYPNNLPKGMQVGMNGNNGWKLSGTPEVNSEKPIRLTLQVKDNANQTTDTLAVTIPKIEKGAQPNPTADENTGLDSQITEEKTGEGEAQTAVRDGQIIGMYSRGPQDTATYLPGKVDGTGTMSGYYVAQGMIYEYRPVKVDGGTTDVTYTDGNHGWREVPLPESSYTAEQLTSVREAMAKNANRVIKTVVGLGADVEDGQDNVVTVEPVDATKPDWQGAEGWTTEEPGGWKDTYGEIRFDGGVPVVHGLTENDVYEVRFRANSDYTASASVRITIGGLTGTSSGGSTEADVSKIRTVTFYDWDGTTKLGVVAVGVEEDPEDKIMKGKLSKDAYKEFLEPLLNPDAMTIGDDTYETTPNADNEGYIFNPERQTKPLLTDKGGYTFSGWTYMTEDEYGHYPSIDEAQAAVIDWNEEAITVNTDVMACYGGNSLCGSTTGAPAVQRYYKVDFDTVERIGTTVNYSILVRVMRDYVVNSANPTTAVNKYAPRIYEPYLRVQLTVQSSAGQSVFYVPVKLANKDVTQAEITIPANASLAAIAIYDAKDTSSISAASTLSTAISLSGTGANGENFAALGSTVRLNELIRTTFNSNHSANTLPGVTNTFYTNGRFEGVSNANIANKALIEAWKEANGHPTNSIAFADVTTLTYAQMIAAIEGEKNVYLKNVKFDDECDFSEYLQGDITWELVNASDSVTSYSLYWSVNGATRGAKIADITENKYTFGDDDGENKMYKSVSNRFILLYVNSTSGTYPMSAVIPIHDLVGN